MVVLVPFHALIGFLGFGTDLYGYRNQDFAGLWAEFAYFFVEVWHMPMLFLVSGVATFFVMQMRGTVAFLWNRSTRLLLPLVIGIRAID